MLESIFIILLVSAIIFLIIGVLWESMALTALDMFLWFICALGILQIEIVTSTGTTIKENMHYLSLLFVGIGIIIALYLIVYLMLPTISEGIKKRRML